MFRNSSLALLDAVGGEESIPLLSIRSRRCQIGGGCGWNCLDDREKVVVLRGAGVALGRRQNRYARAYLLRI